MYLELILGSMCSGKTKRLLNILTQYADVSEAVIKVLLIVHEKSSNRLEGKDITSEVSRKGVSCHSSDFYKLSDKITLVKANNLKDINVDDVDVVGIDEGQMFPDLQSVVEKWKLEKGKQIYIAGLDGSAKRDIIGQMLSLIPLADDYFKCKAICKDCVKENKGVINPGNAFPAAFSRCLVPMNSNFLVGGKDIFTATCEKHFRMPPEK
jgi:thymidine kinase